MTAFGLQFGAQEGEWAWEGEGLRLSSGFSAYCCVHVGQSFRSACLSVLLKASSRADCAPPMCECVGIRLVNCKVLADGNCSRDRVSFTMRLLEMELFLHLVTCGSPEPEVRWHAEVEPLERK